MNQTARFFRGQLLLTFVFFSSIFILNGNTILFPRFNRIAEVKNYSFDDERDIYETFDSENQKVEGLPLDPFDLMNRLKQAESMNNATTPSDALDEAIHAFDESNYKNVPIE